MPSYYTYLVSSLPSLAFGAKPPFSFDGLLASCKGLIPDEDIEILKACVAAAAGRSVTAANDTFMKWRSFETMLRDELVEVRAQRRREDPAKYLRKDGVPGSAHAAHIAVNASRKPSILEAERTLDLERWHELEELALGHYFDLDVLIIYAFKLLILEKWDKVRSADAPRLLEGALEIS